MTDWKELLYRAEHKKDIDFTKLTLEERELLQEIIADNNIRKSLELLENSDTQKDWIRLNEQLPQGALTQPDNEPEKIVPWWKQINRYAAAIALLAVLTSLTYYLYQSHYFSTPISAYDFPTRSLDGGKLVLADGQTLELSTLATSKAEDNYQVLDEALLAEQWHGTPDTIAYHQLIIPRGAEYRLKLWDGSQIHLNAETSIRFPANGADKRIRDIYMEKGEAFFDVATNDSIPFIVHVGELAVHVKGTSFNINAYDHPQVYTTLVTGQVEATFQGQQTTMQPNHQLVTNEHTASFDVISTDMEAAIGWHHDQLIFDELTLGKVMENLSRWYDYDIVFVDKHVESLLFTAHLQRYSTIDQILYLIEKTEQVYFTVKGQTIFVHQKKGGAHDVTAN